jgi:DNA invertase Pin-like site-specific DNA recombinase
VADTSSSVSHSHGTAQVLHTPPHSSGLTLVAYLRVSTDRQAHDGYGLDVQRDDIARWASLHGHTIVRYYEDTTSGTNELADRGALVDALDALQAHEADGLVVARLDRLARDVIVQEGTLREIWKTGAYAFSADDDGRSLRDDPKNPTNKLVRRILGEIAEWEREMITLRMRAGRRRKADRGGFAYGSPPFGYRSDNGALVPEPSEQATITRARQLREEGLPLRAIADALEAEGHTTKRGRTRWHVSAVSHMLAG